MKNFLIGLVFLTTTSAFAAGAGSESVTTDVYAPKAGGSEFLAGILLLSGKIEKSPISSTVSGFGLSLQYSYGFSDILAFYGQQGYSNYEFNTDPGSIKDKTVGIGDTKIGVKGLLDFGQNYFYYDVGYNSALLAKSKSNSTNNESTAVSTRPALELQGGVGGNFNSLGLGALLGYKLYQDGDKENESAAGSVTTKYKSGTGSSWKLYAQYQANFKLGLAYQESTTDSYDTVTSGLTSSTSKSETKILSVYGILPVAAGSEVLFQLLKPEPKDTAGSTYSLYYLSAAYRLTF